MFSLRIWSALLVLCWGVVALAPSAFAQAAAPPAAVPAPPPAAVPPPGAVPPPAQGLDEDARLAKAVNLYSAGQYEACVTQLSRMLDSKEPGALRLPHIVELARTYLAACHLGAHHADQAEAPLKDAILANPQMRVPDSLTFPPPVIDAFLRARQSLRVEILRQEQEQIRAAEQAAQAADRARKSELERVRELERLAATETVVIKNRRWIAAVPFGVGQFQNRNTTLGTTMLVSQLAALGVFVGAKLWEDRLVSRIHEPDLIAEQFDSQMATSVDLQIIAGYSLLALMAGGILEAELSFVPEIREQRQRQTRQGARRQARHGLRRQMRLEPVLAPRSDGGFFGLRGVF